MSSASPAAVLDALRRHDRAEGLESRARRVHVGEKGEVALLHRDLVGVVKSEHLAAGEAVEAFAVSRALLPQKS